MRPTINPSCAIVGNGNLARHLAHYFRLAGLDVATWSRQAERESGLELAEAIGAAPIVLLLISDDAIASFAGSRPELDRRILVHCSGTLTIPPVVGVHPLMTFGPGLLPLETYQKVPFVGETGRRGFRDLFPTLPNPSYAIDAADKARYHAMVSLAGGLTPLLWERLFVLLAEDLGLPRVVAIPYFDAVAERCRGPLPFVGTGPVARGDRETVALHLAALAADPLHSAYLAFIRVLRPELLDPNER